MDTAYVRSLVDERQKIAHEIRTTVDEAVAAKRSVTEGEVKEKLERLDTRYDSLKAEEERLTELEAKVSSDAVRSRIVEATSQREDESEQSGLLAVVTRAQAAIKRQAREPETVFNLVIDQQKVIEQYGQMRAIADFSDAAALYINDFSTQVAVYQRTLSPLLRVATVITADNGRPIVLPNLTVDPSMTSPGEGTAITENSGTLGEATATPVSYKTLSYISNEAEQDELVGLMGLIARAQGRQLGFSAGTAMSASLLSAATNGGTAGGLGGGSTATFFGYEDLLDIKYGRAYPYRQVGSWLMANGAIKKVRKFTDKNGQYLWQPAIAAGQPDTFDGQPVYEDPGLAAPASATKSVVYGDLSAWVIKQMALRVAVSTEYRFNTDQVAIRTVYRAGGALPDAAALAFLVSANT
jgi:HK97 family phage major capsid protein